MIKLLRVDHRLLHGQVVFAWSNALRPTCILVANDDVPGDEVRKTTLRLSKPAGVKLVMKSIDDSIAAINSGATDKYDLMVVVSNVADACKLADACERVTSIDLGGTKATASTYAASKMVNLTEEEDKQLAHSMSLGAEVFIQAVPSDRKSPFAPRFA